MPCRLKNWQQNLCFRQLFTVNTPAWLQSLGLVLFNPKIGVRWNCAKWGLPVQLSQSSYEGLKPPCRASLYFYLHLLRTTKFNSSFTPSQYDELRADPGQGSEWHTGVWPKRLERGSTQTGGDLGREEAQGQEKGPWLWGVLRAGRDSGVIHHLDSTGEGSEVSDFPQQSGGRAGPTVPSPSFSDLSSCFARNHHNHFFDKVHQGSTENYLFEDSNKLFLLAKREENYIPGEG